MRYHCCIKNYITYVQKNSICDIYMLLPIGFIPLIMFLKFNDYIRLWLLYATIIFILLATLMPIQIKLFISTSSFSLPWDKVAHFLMFMILGYLISYAISSSRKRIYFYLFRNMSGYRDRSDTTVYPK